MILVKNNKPHVYITGPLVLKPGINEVNEKVWDQVKEWPPVKSRLKFRSIEVTAPKALSEIDTKEAEKIILDTFDRVLLKQWQDKENRKAVLKAIEEQLSIINRNHEKKSDE